MRTNQAPLDIFTLSHVAVGAAYRAVEAPWWVALAGSIGFELIENELKRRYPTYFPYAAEDSIANGVADVIAVMAGYGALSLYNRATGE